MSKFYIIALFCFSISTSITQTIEPKHTFTIELGLPNGFINKPFKNIMQGLVNIAPYYQYAFKNHIIVGAGVRYSYFTINQFKVPSPVDGGMHSGGVFLKAGWEKFQTDRFATDFSLRAGYTQNYFISFQNDSIGKEVRQVNSVYIEPSMGFILTVDEFSSYRMFVSYGVQGFVFRPDLIGLQTLAGYSDSEYNKASSFLIVGFGFTHYFKSK